MLAVRAESPGWQPQAARVVSAVRALIGEAVVGVYVHGSAALGGWTSASDLDVLVTTSATDVDWSAVGKRLLAALDPTPAVELSVVSATAAAAARPPWTFLVHVDQGGRRVATDDGTGDRDLLMHYLVIRHSGIILTGPEPEDAFGAVPRPAVLVSLADELAWALGHADQKYAVLNACRALAYCCDGAVLSKTAGAEWALSRGHERELIATALKAQIAGGDLGPPTPTARAFVADCVTHLEQACGDNGTRAR